MKFTIPERGGLSLEETMELLINDKTYKFTFGIAFLRELDKKAEVEKNGIKFGIGLDTAVPFLFENNPIKLEEILLAANKTETPKVTVSELDSYIENVDDIEALFDDVINELQESNVTKLKVKAVKALMEKQTANQSK